MSFQQSCKAFNNLTGLVANSLSSTSELQSLTFTGRQGLAVRHVTKFEFAFERW